MTSATSSNATEADAIDGDYRAALVAAHPEARRVDVQAFFEIIEAPANLRGIALVMPVVAEALKILSGSADPGVKLWAQTWIAIAKEVTQVLNAGQVIVPAARRSRLRTLCETNPVYAALLCTASTVMSTTGTHVLAFLLHALARDREQLSRHQVDRSDVPFVVIAQHGARVLKQVSGDATTPIVWQKKLFEPGTHKQSEPHLLNYVCLVEICSKVSYCSLYKKDGHRVLAGQWTA